MEAAGGERIKLRSLSIGIPARVPPTPESLSPDSDVCFSHEFVLSDIDRVGRVGSGHTVFKAAHRPTGGFCALRVVAADRGYPAERFVCQRGVLLRSLDCLNLVKFHDVFITDAGGELQIVTEFMDGASLKGRHVPDEHGLSSIAEQILRALSYLHERRIVHRDIRPPVFMINGCNQVKLAKLELSVLLPWCKSSIAYLSPERIGMDSDQGFNFYDGFAGDVWSFGISILELHLGRLPLGEGMIDDISGTVRKICVSSPPDAPPPASPELQDFIRCCLTKDPADRWTASQLMQHPFIRQYDHKQSL